MRQDDIKDLDVPIQKRGNGGYIKLSLWFLREPFLWFLGNDGYNHENRPPGFPYPQVLVNAGVKKENKEKYKEDFVIMEEIRAIEEKMMGQGRVLIRPSGTEALVRVMLEGRNQDELNTMATGLARLIEERLG